MATKTTNPHLLGRISSPALATSFAARALKASRIFLGHIKDDGQDGEYWVVTIAEGEHLLAAGYTELR